MGYGFHEERLQRVFHFASNLHLCRPREINPEDRECSRKRVKSSAAHTSIDRAARVRENMSRTKRIETFSGTRDKALARR